MSYASGLLEFHKTEPFRCYAGIGSRETPTEVQETMNSIARAFCGLRYKLRSGGADGADKAFEGGIFHERDKEIWLPWKGFNESESRYFIPNELSPQNPKHSQWFVIGSVARKYHPAWDRLSQGGKRMMTRNVCQVLGYDLKSPVEFVVCWTKDGGPTGGTGQAIRIAEDRGIPVFNLFYEDHLSGLRNFYRHKSRGALV